MDSTSAGSLPKDPVNLQLVLALREATDRGWISRPTDPQAFNRFAEQLSQAMLKNPMGSEVQHSLMAATMLGQPVPKTDSPSLAQTITSVIISLAKAQAERPGNDTLH